MATGLEALGAASAVLQVISFASDLVVACKNAYDGATTPQDDLERHSKQMFEAVGRVHARCERMATANSQFADPELHNIAKDCENAAMSLEVEVQRITSMQAKGSILRSIRKAIRAPSHQKKLKSLEDSLTRHQQLIQTELTSHLCSQMDAIDLQQGQSFQRLDTDVQLLINQLAQGVTEIRNLINDEHATTRAAFTQVTARAESDIKAHTYTQVLDLKITNERNQQCSTFLQSLKGARMNKRYNDVTGPEDASFNQVFATYPEIVDMYRKDYKDDKSAISDHLQREQYSEGGHNHTDLGDDIDSVLYQLFYSSSDLPHETQLDVVWRSWDSFISWLQSDEVLFYIEGKPGSGKSTLVKFILDDLRTLELIQRWSPDATIIRYFFWKIGSHEQKSIKGLWCSILYQRLQSRLSLIPHILLHFEHLSSHTSYHDWTVKDLQDVWEYAATLDGRPFCIFIDGLDEIQNEDGFAKVIQSIQILARYPRTKLCVSTRPETKIMRWLKGMIARGIRLEDLTKHDMIVFVRDRLLPLLDNRCDLAQRLRKGLVDKAEGVFLWLHLAMQSLIEGIENNDPDHMLLRRLDELPEDLEMLYMDMWQRLNPKNSIYRQEAARYFRYALLGSSKRTPFVWNESGNITWLPFGLQLVCAESPEIQETFLSCGDTIDTRNVQLACEEMEALIRTRCAGLLVFRTKDSLLNNRLRNAFGNVEFIHRTAHDFLTETDAGRRILEHDSLSEISLQCLFLKGLICAMVAASTQFDISWQLANVIKEITRFAKSSGTSSMVEAFELLDIMRRLYDKSLLQAFDDAVHCRRSFFSFLTHDDYFDDFVISKLTVANSTQMATCILREGWDGYSDMTLSKRLFDALLSLGADPHECGIGIYNTMLEPFVSKEPAFIRLLLSFYFSREVSDRSFPSDLTSRGYNSHVLGNPCDVIRMATRMASTCDNLDASIALLGCFSKNHALFMQLLLELGRNFLDVTHYIVYDINLQFLLLYLLARSSGEVAQSVLESLGAQDLLPRLKSPRIRMRYFLLPNEVQPIWTDLTRVTCHRVAPNGYDLPQDLIRHLLQSSTTGYSIEVDLQHQSDGTFIFYDTKTDVGTVVHGIKDSEIEEISFETMVADLANESPHICTYEEAEIIPSATYLRRQRADDHPAWHWFPSMMEQLEAAAASREERRVDEDIIL